MPEPSPSAFKYGSPTRFGLGVMNGRKKPYLKLYRDQELATRSKRRDNWDQLEIMWLPSTSELALDAKREHRINANSFQQDAITSFRGWQYVCFYSNKDDDAPTSPLLVNMGRRQLSGVPGPWEILTFLDYEQTVDDGHNTISMGICPGDGTIHVSFDHHCDELRFRLSVHGVASDPDAHRWAASLFTPVLNRLPGSIPLDSIFSDVSYPRFLALENDLILSYRIGKAGAGSDLLFKYRHECHNYLFLGQFLTGVGNSPYINGLSYGQGRIHVSGTYRRFVDYEGADDPSSMIHKANAGPNGPENNENMFYTYSDDQGDTFYSSDGAILARLGDGQTILPTVKGLIVFDIPMDSGIMNQESQATDAKGGFHVLNRENEQWMHYYRSPIGKWSKYVLPGPRPTTTGARGSVVALLDDTLVFALPGNRDNKLTIVGTQLGQAPPTYRVLWEGEGFEGEPHLDVCGLDSRGTELLSVFTRTGPALRRVIVLDFVKSPGETWDTRKP